jgi:hypothetical protein
MCLCVCCVCVCARARDTKKASTKGDFSLIFLCFFYILRSQPTSASAIQSNYKGNLFRMSTILFI